MKKILLASIFLFAFSTINAADKLPADTGAIMVPVAGNTWRNTEGKTGGRVTNEGITGWTDPNVQFTSYIRINAAGTLKLWIKTTAGETGSVLKIIVNKKSETINIVKGVNEFNYAGEWNITDTGYLPVSIIGVQKSGLSFPDIISLQLDGTAINEKTAYVKNNEGNFFYWGRRGPSVHLNYTMPENVKAEWFYNEITVQPCNDVIGSYYMANGFGEGYFGIQVNSATERRILFSVWSPFNTDDPKKIPEDQKIELLKKGEGVQTGEFGNEGSGGQSFKRFNWKAGVTYGFLLHGIPDGPGHTIYTAYFFDPEKNDWMLIAGFRRPKLSTYLTRVHSFLENFNPETGDKYRKVSFSNQWIRDENGNWHELAHARFTADNTARKNYRMDYAGGQEGNNFFLANCGFFAAYTPINKILERKPSGKFPSVDFGKLKQLQK